MLSIASSYMSPNAREGWEVAGSQPISTAVYTELNNFGDLTPYLTFEFSK
jgi:hypothetical protein